jgi:hypothetical protein
MSTNRDLLKEAIADAKAVKETAIANAKAALEEAFTPQIKSMLAAQILAEEEDDDDLAEADKVNKEKEEMEEGYGMDDTNEAEEIDEEFDLEEILAELELEEGEDLEEETSEPHGNIGANTPEGEPLGFLEEEINLDEMDEDELKALIEDVIEDMIESGELEAGGDPVEFSDEEEGEEEIEDEEEVELSENLLAKTKGTAKGVLKSLAGYPEDVYKDALTKLKANPELKDNKEFMAMLNAAKTFWNMASGAKSAGRDIGTGAMGENKNMKKDINEFDFSVPGSNPAIADDAQAIALFLSTVVGLGGGSLLLAYLQDEKDALIDKFKQIIASKNPKADAKAAAEELKDEAEMNENLRKFKKEKSVGLDEALKTIKILKKEINESNLLNSKLLYVNKIFRNKNLTESQKVKVLSAFDKATSVRETKVIYETLNEGLVSKTTTKSSIKESLGMASKPAGVAPKQPIVESDQMVQRFQKLAGIL